MAADLQSFLKFWEERHPEDVVRISQPVHARYQVTALATKLERERRFPILVFDDVRTEAGGQSAFPLVTYLMSSRRRLAELMQEPAERLGIITYERSHQRQQPVVVSRSEAPVKEVVCRGDEADLTKLPALVHHEMDPGPYISSGFLTCYHPELGTDNSALHRGWIHGPREIRILMEPSTHNGHIFALHERRNEDMRVAYWVGAHPLVILGCETRIPLADSHFAAAGGLLGEPLRLVPSETLGDDFLVPADAEFIIEGVMPAGKRRPEGPFGEYTRYSGPQRWNPYFEVTAITHRANAHWYDLMVGHSHCVGSLTREGAAYEKVRRAVPTITNIYCPMSGCGQFHLYLQIDKIVEGSGKVALMEALTSHHLVKHAWVFDTDVDIFDEQQVMQAFATRFQGDRDLVLLPGLPAPTLDPSRPSELGTKTGFDCTKPVDPKQFARKLSVPRDVMDKMDLDNFIPPEQLNKIPYERYG